MKYIEENSTIWDERSENNDIWSIPVTSEMIQKAREGIWSILLTPTKPVPANWFPNELRGKKILCLASGGGQQGPILAAVGAEITVFDNSVKQLEKDRFVATRDHLDIKTVQGNMQDLSVFATTLPRYMTALPFLRSFFFLTSPIPSILSKILDNAPLLLISL